MVDNDGLLEDWKKTPKHKFGFLCLQRTPSPKHGGEESKKCETKRKKKNFEKHVFDVVVAEKTFGIVIFLLNEVKI